MARDRRRNWGYSDPRGYPSGPVQLPHGHLPPPPGAQYPPGYYPGHPYPPPPPEDKRSRALRRMGLAGASAILLIPFLILLVVFLLLVFVGKPYIVHGLSMMATLHDGDRVFVVPYRGNTTPNRDDVVVLRDIADSPEMLIKRVVAIAGDRVTIENGYVVVNEKYRHRSTNRYVANSYTQMVPDNSVFVMGDNEAHSFDSRTFGTVPLSKVVGKALIIFWPPGDWKKL
ncbi:MAG: signal peptidase I [Candidatus Geothermincolia bacterium]